MRSSFNEPMLLREVVERSQNVEISSYTIKKANFTEGTFLGIQGGNRDQAKVVNSATNSGLVHSRDKANGASKDIDDEFEMQNTLMVQSMTPDQIQAALREVESSLSQRSIDFLRKRGDVDLKQAAAAIGVTAEDCPSVHVDALFASIDDKVTECPDWAKPSYRPTDLRAKPSALAHSASDRFDLEGRKIIDCSSFVVFFSKLFYEDEYVKQVINSEIMRLIEDFSRDLFSAAEYCGLIRSVACTSADYHECDDESLSIAVPMLETELFHHEYEQERPGYSLSEACEVL